MKNMCVCDRWKKVWSGERKCGVLCEAELEEWIKVERKLNLKKSKWEKLKKQKL